MEAPTGQESRRPLKTRRHAWARKLAHAFVRLGVSPNQMSLASLGIALLGAGAYGSLPMAGDGLRPVLFGLAAASIQLRLLANMLDGLMAVEEGQKTPTGILYNELPDRLADSLFLVAAGYAAGMPDLGWAAALLAVGTAYVRAFGASLGFPQDYGGPMAKQHRMFTLTLATLVAAVLPHQPVLALALGVIILGSAVTIWRRTRGIARQLCDPPHD